jgi:hypothetical protein
MSSPAVGYNSGFGAGRMPATRPSSGPARSAANSGDSLADLLERVLDKGVVIAGDIVINILDIELLTLKVRLLIASADTAKEMGIDWWTSDPFLSGRAKELESENRELRDRLDRLERALGQGPPSDDSGETSPGDSGTRREPTSRRS